MHFDRKNRIFKPENKKKKKKKRKRKFLLKMTSSDSLVPFIAKYENQVSNHKRQRQQTFTRWNYIVAFVIFQFNTVCLTYVIPFNLEAIHKEVIKWQSILFPTSVRCANTGVLRFDINKNLILNKRRPEIHVSSHIASLSLLQICFEI